MFILCLLASVFPIQASTTLSTNTANKIRIAEPPACPPGSICQFPNYWAQVHLDFCSQPIMPIAVKVCTWIDTNCGGSPTPPPPVDVDCKLSSWSDCSATCGEGVQTRFVSVASELNGKVCPDRTKEKIEYERSCMPTLSPCDKDCDVTDWSECSKPCGGGTRTREIKSDAVGNGKICGLTVAPCSQDPCPRCKNCGSNTDEKDCVTWVCPPPSPVNCVLTEWSECSGTCGDVIQTRSVQTFAKYGGTACPPSKSVLTTEVSEYQRPCVPAKPLCDQDCEVTQWTECTKKCNGGTRTREVLVKAVGDGIQCGDTIEDCNTQICPKCENCGSTGEKDCIEFACPCPEATICTALGRKTLVDQPCDRCDTSCFSDINQVCPPLSSDDRDRSLLEIINPPGNSDACTCQCKNDVPCIAPQRRNPSTCQCECNVAERVTCDSQPRHTWDRNTCSCSCDITTFDSAIQQQSSFDSGCMITCADSVVSHCAPKLSLPDCTGCGECSDTSACENIKMIRENDCKCRCLATDRDSCLLKKGEFDETTCSCSCLNDCGSNKAHDPADCSICVCSASSKEECPLPVQSIQSEETCGWACSPVIQCSAAAQVNLPTNEQSPCSCSCQVRYFFIIFSP